MNVGNEQSVPTYSSDEQSVPNRSAVPTLWQFLLELLMDKTCWDIIKWTGNEWEFRLIDPDEVR